MPGKAKRPENWQDTFLSRQKFIDNTYQGKIA
jgi:hypothetical protein